MLDDRTVLDHRLMLEDRLRLEAYRRSIDLNCRDRVVVEIGTGLGPLALFALRAGARRVYGIEVDPRTLGLATDLIRAHGFGPDRFVPLCGRSDRLDLPEPADVLVSELLDSAAVGENALFYVEDARRRWLAPDGIVIPRSLRVDVALAGSEEFARERRFWSEDLLQRHGIDFAPIAGRLLSPRRSLHVRQEDLLTDWTRWQDLDLQAGDTPLRRVLVDLRTGRDGRAEGLALAFRAELGDGAVLDTHPAAGPTHWSQGWLPLPASVPVGAGGVYAVELELPPTDEPWAPIRAALDVVVEPRLA